MKKQYIDMRTGLINLQGIRNIKLMEDSTTWTKEGLYTIIVSYKGMQQFMIYRYTDKSIRDSVWEEIKKELIK